jgi:hypothetical protein
MGIVIHNLRAGFATNSSSSHSVVMIPESLVGRVGNAGRYDDAHYGEADFRLVSPEFKLRYLAAQLVYGIERQNQREDFVKLFSPLIPDIENLIERDLGVDGNASITLPPDPLHPAYMKTMLDIFMSDRVVVYGGHDGGSNPFEVDESSDIPAYEMLKSMYRTTIRTEGPYMVVFDRSNGNKMRMSGAEAPPYVKSLVPELVDLKITDYCAQGCNFCYQSSTKKGKHGKFAVIEETIDMLSDLGVFEIALGGGEPTDHPDFVDIIRHIKKRDMVANFTTLSDRWLSDPRMVTAVQENVGAIGVSCASAKGLELVEDISNKLNDRWDRVKVMAQHVVGAQPLWVTAEFMNEAFAKKIPVLLLGYKEVGFGKKFTRHDTGQDVPFYLRMAVNNVPDASLSVDTALLDQYPTIPDVLAVPLALTTSPEGKFSCYIDAVTKKMGPSSYVEPSAMEKLVLDRDGFRSAYAAY